MSVFRPSWTPGDLAHWLRHWLGDSADADKAEAAERMADGPWMVELAGLTVHDRRDEPRPYALRRGRPRAPRPWSAISGVTLHQTANRHLDADHPRLLGIPAHIVVHRDGSVTLLHPLTLRMPHGNALNGDTIGIEVQARAYGVLGDRRTFWRSKKDKAAGRTAEELVAEATGPQLDSLRKVLDYCRAALAYHARPCHVYAHRQASKDRGSDPGERIARVVDEWRVLRMLPDVRDEVRGSGQPWPAVWRAS